MATVRVELPDALFQQLHAFVAEGWFSSESDLVQEAVRRYLEARSPGTTERFMREDVEWGLGGRL